MCFDFLYEYLLILSELNENWIFRKIFENPQISDFIKIRPVGAELFHADRPTEGWTGMTKKITAFFFTFANFAIAPKNSNDKLST